MMLLSKISGLLLLSTMAAMVVPGTLASQPLDSLLKLLELRNPELQGYTFDYQASRQEALAAGNLPPSEFGLGIFALPVETRLGPQWIRLSAGQSFPWPGTLSAQKELAQTRSATIPVQAAIKFRELALELTEAWLGWYQLIREAALLDRQISLLSSLESRALASVASGKTGVEKVLEIRMEIQKLGMQKEVLEQQVRVPQARINALLNRQTADPLTLADTLTFARTEQFYANLESAITDQYPGFESIELQRKMSEQRSLIHSLQYKPFFSAGIDYIAVGKRSDADPSGNGRDILGPRIGMRLAIDQKPVEALQQREKLVRESLRLKDVALELSIQSRIEEALSNWEEAAIRIEYAENQRELAESILSVLETKYGSGNEGFEDLVKLKIRLLEFDILELKAIVNSHRAVAKITRWISKPEVQ